MVSNPHKRLFSDVKVPIIVYGERMTETADVTEDGRFLLTREVATILRTTEEEVRKRIRCGVLKARMRDHVWLIERIDLDAYIAKMPWRNPRRRHKK